VYQRKARHNGGHNIEMTDVTGCLRTTCIIDFISPTTPWRSPSTDSTLRPSSIFIMKRHSPRCPRRAAARPRAPINFPLFHDLVVGRRLMSTYTAFRGSRVPTVPHCGRFPIKGGSLPSIKAGTRQTRERQSVRARARALDRERDLWRAPAVVKFR